MSDTLSLDQFERIALGQLGFTLSEQQWHNIDKTHRYLLEQVAKRRLIYGVTTGYGPLATTYVEPHHSEELQQNLVHHLCSGVGPALTRVQTRSLITARLLSLSRGHSGASPALVQRLAACLEHDFVPEIPSQGTVGASGDLTPLAHLARALSGGGRVRLHGGDWQPSADVHVQLGWEPLKLAGKDAIALVNGTSVTAGIAALNGSQSLRMAKLSSALVLLYAELLGGHREAFHPLIGEVRPHPGQRQLHAWLWKMSADSERLKPWTESGQYLPHSTHEAIQQDQPLPQDAYTLRCAPQALGAVMDTIEQHNSVASRELISVTDNPLLFADLDTVLHGGNFFGQHLAFASDHLRNAVIQMALYSERRIARITDPLRNGSLPAFMQPHQTGLHSGFMGAQVTATALVAELRSDAIPASIQSIPTNADNQDIVPLGTIAARKTANALTALQKILAIEAMVLTQAMDIEKRAGFGRCSQQLYVMVRETVATLTQDRPLAEDIEALAGKFASPDALRFLADTESAAEHEPTT
ncbi:HAL/PAL/TAL family ammonia-lyase [Pseudohongiella sp.]|uniref:Histidine ammonia-lyase n=1 Tax=marine sediment metagenome TaxID=412755 RepID=A0A0F9WHS7_9ZZZZ|nr:aromatic amino acid ammonia-lyase [Pseudohongiella sp.]HDZ07820.1 aromatic amino acid lyase [Pseudohongiella sp.]HEA62863.1 aromatic amino acid lyase [Pseudohongiella sp.]